MAGHGAQKLFGVFGGQGPAGMAGWLDSIGLKPPTGWAYLAGASEFGSGLSLALGLGTPVGAVAVFGPMLMAWDKVHRGKPIWVASGGPEVPILFMAIATALGTVGPGRYSLDALLKIKTPTLLVAATAIGVAAGVAVGVLAQPEPESADRRPRRHWRPKPPARVMPNRKLPTSLTVVQSAATSSKTM